MGIKESLFFLSKLDLKTALDNLIIDVLWFKVISTEGEWHREIHESVAFEFYFVQTGSCLITPEDETCFTVKEGEFFLTTPGVKFSQRYIDKDKHVEYYLNCELKLAEDSLTEADNILKVLTEVKCGNFKDTLDIAGICKQILDEVNNKEVGFYNLIKTNFREIIIKVARIVCSNITDNQAIVLKNEKEEYQYLQIEKFIEHNIYNTILTKDIAKALCKSEKQIYRIIQKKMGISTKEFILQSKLKKVKELLLETKLTIKQISEMFNFSNVHNFSRLFKTKEGCSPSCFKANAKFAILPYKDDFSNGVTEGWTVIEGEWSIIKDDKNVYHSIPKTDAARAIVGALSWSNYEVSVDFKVNSWFAISHHNGSSVGIMTRYWNTSRYYIFIYINSIHKLRIIKQIAGVFAVLAEKDYSLNEDIWHTFKAVNDDETLKFYVNNILELTAENNELDTGSVGLIQFNSDIYFSDFTVNAIS